MKIVNLHRYLEEQRKRKAIEACSQTKAKMDELEKQALGLKVGARRPPHMAFLGNPGTGKTMVARILGKLLHGPDRRKIQEAEGGFFVDEAYRLIPMQKSDDKDYGLEALEEIMSVMDSGKIVVIFAGYSEPMKRVIASNEGFCRRVTKFFHFDNFSSEDLAKILHLKMTNQADCSLLYGFKLHPSCSSGTIELPQKLYVILLEQSNRDSHILVSSTLEWILAKWAISGLQIPRFQAQKVFSRQLLIDNNDSPEQFLQNNSIADFMRFKKSTSSDDRVSTAELQTAVVTYRKKFPWSLLQPFLQVDLVSTIHIADKSTSQLYKRNLNHMIVFSMRWLDCLDYEGDNWYHADLDFETFKLLQLERRDFFTFARDMTLRSTKALVQPTIPEDLDHTGDPNFYGLLGCCRCLLLDFLSLETFMPDLGRRLREEFELVPSEVQWITAWSIRNRNLTTSSLPLLKQMAEVSGWPLNRYQTLALLIFSSVLALDLWFWELFFETTANWISQVASDIIQYVHMHN
ncbi:hypothetical protein HAX54_051171 [Datura stramonium]|uniref:AAA+ ATPase domain-containing protein n=1 Tax=Datura stramonium TaxID=4076 RepID=A0ABS8WRW9_DATST|nr:hypothetical protein [Datura stramonium]